MIHLPPYCVLWLHLVCLFSFQILMNPIDFVYLRGHKWSYKSTCINRRHECTTRHIVLLNLCTLDGKRLNDRQSPIDISCANFYLYHKPSVGIQRAPLLLKDNQFWKCRIRTLFRSKHLHF